MFQLMFVHYTLRSVWVVEWPYFWKKLPARLVIMFPMSFVYLYDLFISHFGFKKGILLLIAQVSFHCFPVTICIY